MPEDYKEVTKATYDAVVPVYSAIDDESTDETADVLAALKEFMELLPEKASVLDIGCAAGRDVSYFTGRGFNVTGIDFSSKMIDQAKRRVPSATFKVLDFESLKYQNKFDGVWANASLHHVPKKDLPSVLKLIHRALKPKSIFFIKVKKGRMEGMQREDKFNTVIRRYIAFYQNDELKQFLREAGFTILSLKNTTRDEWIDVIARKHG